MKNKRIILNLAVIFFSVTNGFSQNVNWISSTEKQPWKTKEAIKVSDANAATAVDIEILTDKKQQTIDGWGGCFNELGWQALNTLPFKERDKVIKEFFDPLQKILNLINKFLIQMKGLNIIFVGCQSARMITPSIGIL